jgi:hypothetical protein
VLQEETEGWGEARQFEHAGASTRIASCSTLGAAELFLGFPDQSCMLYIASVFVVLRVHASIRCIGQRQQR